MPRARLVALFAIVVVIATILWKNKALFVVASVNGRLIPRWELEKKLVSHFGSQTLEEVISEQLILQEGKKKGVKIDEKEIDAKIAEIQKSLGDKVSLSDALASQGLSLEEFRWQVRLQLTLEKLARGSIVVSDKDVADYLEKNRSSMSATDEAELEKEARQSLTAQRKNDVMRQLFNDLKSKAKIVKYL